MKTLINMKNSSDNGMSKKKEGFGAYVWIIGHKCYRCEHKWTPREEEQPAVCPKCKSPYWNKPKKKTSKKKSTTKSSSKNKSTKKKNGKK